MGAQLFEELQETAEEASQELIPEEISDNNRAPVVRRTRTRRRNEVKRALRVPNLQQMEVLKPQQIVVSIPDPDNPEEEWDIIVQELSPGQYALLNNTAFARNSAAARAKMDALNLDPDDESPEAQEKIREVLRQDDTLQTVNDFNEYKIEVCLLGIVEPEGLTREIIQSWASSVVDELYQAIMQGTEAADEVDAFPNEDTGSGDAE